MEQKVKLIGITKKGKERVKQHGEIWEVQDVSSSHFPGCVLLFAPDGDWRWVHPKNDPNFDLVVL